MDGFIQKFVKFFSFVRKIYTLLYEESNTYYSVSVVATHDLMAILSVRIIYG